MSSLNLTNENTIVCASCGHPVSLGTTKCSYCSNFWTLEDIDSIRTDQLRLAQADPSLKGGNGDSTGTRQLLNPNAGFLSNLFDGNYGLPKTYWLYGFLVGWILTGVSLLIILTSKSPEISKLVLAVIIGYQIYISIAVFNAARKYDGSAIWKNLARIAIIISALNTLRGCAS